MSCPSIFQMVNNSTATILISQTENNDSGTERERNQEQMTSLKLIIIVIIFFFCKHPWWQNLEEEKYKNEVIYKSQNCHWSLQIVLKPPNKTEVDLLPSSYCRPQKRQNKTKMLLFLLWNSEQNMVLRTTSVQFPQQKRSEFDPSLYF